MENQLSFSVTESELNRVISSKLARVTVDPRGQADMTMLIIIASAYCLDVLAVVYMLWNRKYPPIKSKSPIIMAMMMAISIIWFVGDLQANGHVPLAVPLANCLFNRQRYLENWINKLRKDGLQRMYEFDPDTFVTNGRESLLLTNTVLGKTDEQFYPVQDSIYGYKDADSSYKSNMDYPMNS
ncbi:hypothetical protein GGF37_001178 [Kickxella alabastrina]|nr:hypothetical protein GGF37_001178 [Kickxella alabastrina]